MLLSNLDLLATAPGGVARLRELILTLAVQGKLVPQDPADEPASVLLQKIRAEKDRLIAEGKIKRDKPLAEIGEEEKPFELPVGWSFCRLGDLLLSIRSGGTPSKQNPAYWDGDIPWASVKDLGFGETLTDTQDRITGEGLQAGSQLATAGSILICTRMGLGKIGEALIDVAINQDLKAVQLGAGVHKQYFINYFKTLSVVGSGMTVAGIKQDELLGFVVPLPSEAEQSRIVARVEELMRLCDALQAKAQLEATQHAQLVSTLLGTLTASTTPEELAANWQRVAQHFDLLLDRPEAIDALEQTLLQLAVRGLLVPQDPTDEPASVLLQKIRAEKDRLIAAGQIKRDKPLPPITDEEKPFELPVGWEWVRLQQAYDVRDGTHDTPKYQSTGFPLVTSKNLYGGVLDLSDVKLISPADHEQISARSRVDRDDILFAMIGSIGNPVIVDIDTEFSVKNVALFKYYAAALSCPKYLLLVLQAEAAGMKERAAGGVQSFISLGQLRSSVVALPPLSEQSRIVNRVTALRRLCSDLRQRLAERQSVQARLAEALVASVA
ncbi:restriction endonuclease subunit S [Acidovorax sp.]|uniref:restriction endonuclease subunit S n=1 Tax=Acidovorax sp. TaxID=1872122 RepID=UPI00258FB001|nr:restriction endonuclease subunit S [Acidovorax sp.]